MKRFRKLNILKFFKSNNFILFLIFITIFLIPSLFWGNLYQVGGDDTRLYYLFPKEFLQNFVFNVASNNSLGVGTGYTSIAFFAPIISISFLLKQISFMNTQFLMYGLNLGLGFLFFYFLLGIWIENNNKYDFFLKVSASLFYILSVFIIKTLYSYQLLSIFLVAAVPMTLFFFVKAIKEKKAYLILLSALIFSVLSSTLNTFPWIIAFFITFIPFLLKKFYLYKKTFLIYSVLFVLSLIFLNLYWLIHYLYSFLHDTSGSNLVSFVNSSNFKLGNDNLISALSGLNSPLNQFFSYVRVSWTENDIFSNAYIPSVLFITVIAYAGILLRKSDSMLKRHYSLFIIGLLTAFFLFTPNFGNWSTNVFTYLNNYVPFFSIVRTMYDKFSFALAFNYALVFAISLKIVFDKASNAKIKNLLLIVIVLIIFINSRDFIMPKFNDGNFSTRITDFNKDYYDLTNYIKNMHEASRFLWLPLTKPSYVVIEDKKLSNHYYWGPSPLQLLANTADFTGFLSFSTISDRSLSGSIEGDILSKDYENVAKKLQRLNVNYLIINNNLTPKISSSSYLFDKNLYNNQMYGLKNILLGDKIKDFGNRYSLYSINRRYLSKKLFLSDNFYDFPKDYSDISYTKITNYEYKIQIRNLQGEKKLLFLETYNKEWNLYLNNNIGLAINHSIPVLGYANGWTINRAYIQSHFNKNLYKINSGSGMDLTLTLYFQPQKLALFANVTSLLTFIIYFILIVFFMSLAFWKKKSIRYWKWLRNVIHQKFKMP